MIINDKIKVELQKRGWSIYKLAKLSNISNTAIKSWFKPIPTKPTYDSIKRVAKAFGMSVEDLISENKETDPQKQQLLELWNRLESQEKSAVIAFMETILNHNK
ncbi:MAG: helix-turn-helix transcriptional regulator [Clostridia bacterium]|nr:helix-turn-helix transcriptional regulator [Clostridia bacterium]